MFLLAALWQFLTYNGFPNDHYFHVARARQMLLGEWPVRDFVDPGAPLQYVISALSRWLFGDIAAAELVVVAFGVAVGAAATVVCCIVAGAFRRSSPLVWRCWRFSPRRAVTATRRCCCTVWPGA